MAEYVLLDTGSFEAFISSRRQLQERYSDIQKEYDTIVKSLLNEWKGRGADAFYDDSEKVKKNLLGIKEILSTMCDMLNDCLDVFRECDKSLGENNKNATAR